MSVREVEVCSIDDMHLHVRDGKALETSVPAALRSCSRAIIMPNTKPPVVNVNDAAAYRNRILEVQPSSSSPSHRHPVFIHTTVASQDCRQTWKKRSIHATDDAVSDGPNDIPTHS